MGKELVLYSEALLWRGVYERLNRFIEICSRRKEIEMKANEICKPYSLKAEPLPIPTTSVKGDKPEYGCLMEIRGKFPGYEILGIVSIEIINEIDGISRVVYLIK